MIIYIDILFLVNFIIDSILIYATAIVTKFRIHILRLAVSATISAIYGVIMFFPNIGFIYTGAAKIIFSSLLIIFTFRTYSLCKFFKTALIFYFVSFIFGGAVFAAIFITGSGKTLGAVISNGELYLNLNAGMLFLTAILAYTGIIAFTKICRRNFSRDKVLKELTIKFGERKIKAVGLIDTGCELTDPITNKPAVLIERSCIGDSLKSFPKTPAENLMTPESLSNGIRVIPFSSIGCENGFLEAFESDNIEIADDELYISGKVTVGIAEFNLSNEGLYNAILNPDILEIREENKTRYVEKFYKFFKN